DPIKMHKPEVCMLKLMTGSENSEKGIGQVFEHLMEQLGLDENSFASQVQQVEEGDLGTVQNLNSAEHKKFLVGHPEENLQNFMHWLAGAHTMWNMTSEIVGVYMGNPNDSQDPQVCEGFGGLGIKADQLFDAKDFGFLMTAVHKIHSVMLAFFTQVSNGFIGENREFTSSKGPESDFSQPDVAERLIDEVYDKDFISESICNAEETKDHAIQNLWLRLQDFATTIEAEHAMHAEDIGHLMVMWKRWAILAQGI
ncbi:hypothetical protein CROQUDRAFT_15295, partial [Cronartium quercuum f. sp. fusiforme G11]